MWNTMKYGFLLTITVWVLCHGEEYMKNESKKSLVFPIEQNKTEDIALTADTTNTKTVQITNPHQHDYQDDHHHHHHGEDGKYNPKDDGTGWDIRKSIPGEPNIDYPVYYKVPPTDFTCASKTPGYYADMGTRCQAFRICTTASEKAFTSFLCPNGSLFNQQSQTCDWWQNVDCNVSELFYSKNDATEMPIGNQLMEVVQKMLNNPFKQINQPSKVDQTFLNDNQIQETGIHEYLPPEEVVTRPASKPTSKTTRKYYTPTIPAQVFTQATTPRNTPTYLPPFGSTTQQIGTYPKAIPPANVYVPPKIGSIKHYSAPSAIYVPAKLISPALGASTLPRATYIPSITNNVNTNLPITNQVDCDCHKTIIAFDNTNKPQVLTTKNTTPYIPIFVTEKPVREEVQEQIGEYRSENMDIDDKFKIETGSTGYSYDVPNVSFPSRLKEDSYATISSYLTTTYPTTTYRTTVPTTHRTTYPTTTNKITAYPTTMDRTKTYTSTTYRTTTYSTTTTRPITTVSNEPTKISIFTDFTQDYSQPIVTKGYGVKENVNETPPTVLSSGILSSTQVPAINEANDYPLTNKQDKNSIDLRIGRPGFFITKIPNVDSTQNTDGLITSRIPIDVDNDDKTVFTNNNANTNQQLQSEFINQPSRKAPNKNTGKINNRAQDLFLITDDGNIKQVIDISKNVGENKTVNFLNREGLSNYAGPQLNLNLLQNSDSKIHELNLSQVGLKNSGSKINIFDSENKYMATSAKSPLINLNNIFGIPIVPLNPVTLNPPVTQQEPVRIILEPTSSTQNILEATNTVSQLPSVVPTLIPLSQMTTILSKGPTVIPNSLPQIMQEHLSGQITVQSNINVTKMINQGEREQSIQLLRQGIKTAQNTGLDSVFFSPNSKGDKQNNYSISTIASISTEPIHDTISTTGLNQKISLQNMQLAFQNLGTGIVNQQQVSSFRQQNGHQPSNQLQGFLNQPQILQSGQENGQGLKNLKQELGQFAFRDEQFTQQNQLARILNQGNQYFQHDGGHLQSFGQSFASNSGTFQKGQNGQSLGQSINTGLYKIAQDKEVQNFGTTQFDISQTEGQDFNIQEINDQFNGDNVDIFGSKQVYEFNYGDIPTGNGFYSSFRNEDNINSPNIGFFGPNQNHNIGLLNKQNFQSLTSFGTPAFDSQNSNNQNIPNQLASQISDIQNNREINGIFNQNQFDGQRYGNQNKNSPNSGIYDSVYVQNLGIGSTVKTLTEQPFLNINKNLGISNTAQSLFKQGIINQNIDIRSTPQTITEQIFSKINQNQNSGTLSTPQSFIAQKLPNIHNNKNVNAQTNDINKKYKETVQVEIVPSLGFSFDTDAGRKEYISTVLGDFVGAGDKNDKIALSDVHISRYNGPSSYIVPQSSVLSLPSDSAVTQKLSLKRDADISKESEPMKKTTKSL